jgi:hypothetical protein
MSNTELDINNELDTIIETGKFNKNIANSIEYNEEKLYNFRNVKVQAYRTSKYVIYRPLKKIDRIPEMYCFSEIENFFLRDANDSNVCYFGANNFDDFADELLPVKVFKI